MGVYAAGAYDEAGEVSGIKQVLVVELKRGGFQLTQRELDQARNYAKELYKSADVKYSTRTVVYVLGATNEEQLGDATYNDGAIRVVPMLYSRSRYSTERILERSTFSDGLSRPV